MNTATLKDGPEETTGTAQLAVRARAAYQQKRAKECIELTKQLLLADADNEDGKALHAAVMADIERDITDARVLLEESRRMTEGQKYRKAAEIILLKILHIEPSHAEAQSLMAAAKASAHASAGVEEMVFTAHPEPVEKKPAPRSSGMARKLPLIIGGAVVLLAGGFFLLRSNATDRGIPESASSVSTPTPTPTPVKTEAANFGGVTLPAAVPVARPAVPDSKATGNLLPASPVPPAPAVAPIVPPVPAPAPRVSAAAESGSLAVSSPTPADIYLGDKYLGSTPTTIQLAPGRYTLEYRHGDLRTAMTHEIKSRETSTALVTFETTVQINARPWAQVFIEGASRRALGQTPLSSVRVPIGSVLTFENPNFPSKSYRVSETDSAIQVAFP